MSSVEKIITITMASWNKFINRKMHTEQRLLHEVKQMFINVQSKNPLILFIQVSANSSFVTAWWKDHRKSLNMTEIIVDDQFLIILFSGKVLCYV